MSEELFLGVFPIKDVNYKYIPHKFKAKYSRWEEYPVSSFIEFGKVKKHAGLAIQERQVENQIVKLFGDSEIISPYSKVRVLDINNCTHKVDLQLFESVTMLMPHSYHINTYICDNKKHPDYFENENTIYIIDDEPCVIIEWKDNTCDTKSEFKYLLRNGEIKIGILGEVKKIKRYKFVDVELLDDDEKMKVVGFPCS